jgi:dimeric dUTPase (all-alpha-NTP-PPase superfamily)
MNQCEKTFYKKVNLDNNISKSKHLLSINIFDKRNLIIGGAGI